MTSRKLFWVWLASFGLLGIILLLLAVVADRASHQFRNFDIAVIGSSNMLHSVPDYGLGRESLLGDGRSHKRVAHLGISEEQSLILLDRAIEDGVKIAFVEANPFIFQFSSNRRQCREWDRPLLFFLKQHQIEMVDAFRGVTGRPLRYGGMQEPLNLSQGQHIDLSKIRSLYPLHFEGPCYPDWFLSLARAAQLKGTRIILILPPRSPAAEALLGRQASDEVMARAKQLATRMGLQLFIPAGPWSNREFVDQAHMNELGRRHFLIAIRQWWQNSQ